MRMKTTSKKKILIVEDEGALLRILSEKFARAGFAAIEAKNGQEGLEKALNEHPDLILLDIIMPLMDGLTMLKKLRDDHPYGEAVPVIIISNLNEIEKITEILGRRSGVIEHLVKSNWSMEDLVKKVRDTLNIYELLKQ